ncbi:hypothetical protein KIN20_026092 [Parelaphostrongylus tenuis]|uniref:BUB1 N-terminal domain-containing protein n=1 Tax=Parelaphostrongylus tenuis TaxID=148309 RepID=A0AAD5QXG6_PARTN|nr:hypothetical protein KIN20_026092 [Parelaphostrongylus tenuis]
MSGDGSSGEGSSLQTTPFQYEWELCRENVKPLRSGRRVDAINQALAQSTYGSKAETLANQQFDNMMKLCEDASDPLTHCLEFCRWFDQTFPSGRQRLYYSLLWKIVHKYAKCPEYIDDERMMRIWEKLADNSLDHGWEIYQHANTIGSLPRCAQLYIRWSQDLEMRGAISDARAVLQRARRNGALPLDAINNEEDRMEMRQLRRCLKKNNDDDDDSWNDEYDENGERVPFTRLTAMGDSFAAPVVRLPCIVGEQGSSKLDRGQQRKQNSSRAGGDKFHVFEDNGEGVSNNLEGIFEMDNHIERFSLSDHDTEKWRASKVPLKKLQHCVSQFTVWQDDNEESESRPTKKTVGSVVLRLRNCLIREMSIEEHLACMFEQKQAKKDLEKIVRKINFDEE